MSRFESVALPRARAERPQAVRCARRALQLIAVCILAGPGIPPAHAAEAAAPAADTKAGEAIYSTNCVACHAGGDNIIDPSKPVRGSAKLKDFETFLAWIRAPKSPMTAFPPEQIPDVQARELYRYVVEALTPPAAK